MSDETDLFLEGKWHTMDIKEVLETLETSSTGISQLARASRRNECGVNIIPKPIDYPDWLCCLLPCLLKTHSMQYYGECQPDYAIVKVNSKWINMVPSGILVGDIVQIVPNMRVPADIRLLEASPDCEFNPHCITGSSYARPGMPNSYSTVYTESLNMAFGGFLCIKGDINIHIGGNIFFEEAVMNLLLGTCIGVTVAIGDNTIMGRMIKKKKWPPI